MRVYDDYRYRMLEEYEELIKKINKLDDYISKSDIDDERLTLMQKQQGVMIEYRNVLCQRILLEMGVDINE